MPCVANRRIDRVRASARAGLCLLALTSAMVSAQVPDSGPKSLLPPDQAGETAPSPSPPAEPAARQPLVPPQVAGAGPADQAAAAPAAIVPPAALVSTRPVDIVPPRDPLAELTGTTLAPEAAGLLDQSNGGYPTDLFAGSDGRFLLMLLAGIDAPLASRWGQILVQRVLLSRAAAPSGVRGGDWLAGRGLALIAMGAASDAHRMIGAVDLGRYTEALYAVAADAALASADPVALCPMAATALALTGKPLWTLADGYCSAMDGDEYGASVRFDQMAGGRRVAAFDLGLAQQTALALAGNAGRAGAVWDKVPALSPWRIGLAAANGVAVPDPLIAAASPAMRAWMARLPNVPIATRAKLAIEAGALGALSAAEVDRILAAETMTLDPAAAGASPGGLIRKASAADTLEDRLDALTDLWKRDHENERRHYGWLVATAVPAARVRVADASLPRAADVARALMAAGMTPAAYRWWLAADQAGADVRAQAWAAVVAADPRVAIDPDLFERWAKDQPEHRARLLAAGLSGLGRGAVGQTEPVIDNAWTRALQSAARARRAGEVVLLAAVGLHGGWANVPPDYLRRIAAALTAVGLSREAALIVAEAAMRG